MIFCERPWYNEPGREMMESKSRSDRYNEDVRTLTLRYAILPWIERGDPKGKGKDHVFAEEPPPSLWKDIIRLHLQASAKDILNSSKLAASKSKNPLPRSPSVLELLIYRVCSSMDVTGAFKQPPVGHELPHVQREIPCAFYDIRVKCESRCANFFLALSSTLCTI